MKNKFKRLFLVLNLILILTALSCWEANSTVAEPEANLEIKVLSKQMIIETALKADKALRTLFNAKNFDSKYSRDNYGLVQNYKNSTELLNYLKNYFTEAAAKDIVKTFCKEMDGRLYVKIGQAGMRIFYEEECNLDVTQKGNILYLHFYKDIGGDTLTQKSQLIYENGLWLFNNWWYI